MRNRRMTAIDEAAVRTGLAKLMSGFGRDVAAVAAANAEARPYLLEAHCDVATFAAGVERFLDGGTR